MSMPNASRYSRELGELSGIYMVEFNPANAINQPFPERGSARNCKVVSIPRDKGRLPYIAVTGHNDRLVLKIDGRQQNIRYVLEKLVGTELSSVTWGPGKWGTRVTFRVKPSEEPVERTIDRIVIDTETTGLDPRYDEILQLSIVGPSGETLWNRKYKPAHVESWPEAARINHIRKSDVKNLKPIQEDMEQIQQIVDRAKRVYAWNAVFDLSFLAEAGLRTSRGKTIDSMRLYAQRWHGRDYCKLSKAAEETGFEYHAHDSLEDSKALREVQMAYDRSAPRPSAFLTPEEDRKRRSHLLPATPEPQGSTRESPGKGTPASQPEQDNGKKSRVSVYWIIIMLAILVGAVVLISVTGSWPAVIVIVLILAFILSRKEEDRQTGNTQRGQ